MLMSSYGFERFLLWTKKCKLYDLAEAFRGSGHN